MNKSTANTRPDKQAERKAPATPLSAGSSALKPGICLAALLATALKTVKESGMAAGRYDRSGTGPAPKGESREGTLWQGVQGQDKEEWLVTNRGELPDRC